MFRVDKRIFGLCALLAAIPAGSAHAQAGQAPASGDASRADFIVAMDAEFRNRDSNADGSIVYAELQQFERNVSLAVAAQENARVFAQLDKDRNGALSQAEFQALVAVPPAPDVNGQLERFDQNRDRSITIVEYRAATLANFDRLDADLNGIVTDAEMKAGNIQPAAKPSAR